MNEVVTRGVASRNRIAIGGHPDGAFLTANVSAHKRRFRADVAGSGAHNFTQLQIGRAHV